MIFKENMHYGQVKKVKTNAMYILSKLFLYCFSDRIDRAEKPMWSHLYWAYWFILRKRGGKDKAL